MENKVTADHLDEEGCLHCGICGKRKQMKVGLMWNAKKERFLQKYDWLHNAQVSFSTGTSGNSEIPNSLPSSPEPNSKIFFIGY